MQGRAAIGTRRRKATRFVVDIVSERSGREIWQRRERPGGRGRHSYSRTGEGSFSAGGALCPGKARISGSLFQSEMPLPTGKKVQWNRLMRLPCGGNSFFCGSRASLGGSRTNRPLFLEWIAVAHRREGALGQRDGGAVWADGQRVLRGAGRTLKSPRRLLEKRGRDPFSPGERRPLEVADRQ